MNETEELVIKADKRRRTDCAKSLALGENPKERRAQLREALAPGFYICRSGKKKIRTLHRLGACSMVPDVDYHNFTYAGLFLPRALEYDCIYKLCSARGVTAERDDSSQSQRSSSSAFGGHPRVWTLKCSHSRSRDGQMFCVLDLCGSSSCCAPLNSFLAAFLQSLCSVALLALHFLLD